MPDLSQLSEITAVIPVWGIALIALAIGILVGLMIYNLYRAGVRKAAQDEAQEILQEAKDENDLRLLEEKERILEIETELWSKDEKTMLESEERIEELEEMAQEKKRKADDTYSQVRQKAVQFENEIKAGEDKVRGLENGLSQARAKADSINSEFVDKLALKLETSRDLAKQEIIANLIQETEKRAFETARIIEEDMKEHSEQRAKHYLQLVLDRFARPQCPERGIAPVYFSDPNQRRILFDDNGENIKTLQEITGCDIILEEGSDMIGVAGFDPVRRELSRRILERCLKEKRPLNPESIRKLAENQKKELLRQIKHDGDQIAKELKLEGLNAEIRQMMGSLRFRYSFTQNQYFHCGEVGWLCGLLSAEIGATVSKKGRRAGLLHDLGKAMDHEMDGGHAVIGANFIQARGEAPDIVHAVKAHHYDEQPASDLAFLVIAADAISGGRPGARRSTIESYNQKVSELERIAKSFDGVTDCYVLSGGRECRVIVNSRKVDDLKSLDLSVKIAKQIEEECNYPGQIKVVIVRETAVVETTKPAHA